MSKDPAERDRIERSLARLRGDPVEVDVERGTEGVPNYDTGLMEFRPTGEKTYTITIKPATLNARRRAEGIPVPGEAD